MNKIIPQSKGSAIAAGWFSEYLLKKLGQDPHAITKLCKAIGMERKSIYDYTNGVRSPKLEVVARIMAFYGDDEIRIPLTADFTPCAYCQHWHQIDEMHRAGLCSKHGKGTVGEDHCKDAKART
jgi:hypothetical protein